MEVTIKVVLDKNIVLNYFDLIEVNSLPAKDILFALGKDLNSISLFITKHFKIFNAEMSKEFLYMLLESNYEIRHDFRISKEIFCHLIIEIMKDRNFCLIQELGNRCLLSSFFLKFRNYLITIPKIDEFTSMISLQISGILDDDNKIIAREAFNKYLLDKNKFFDM